MKPYYSDEAVTIYCGSWRDVVADLVTPESVVLTDPPYGTGGWRRGETGAGSDPSASLVREEWDHGAVEWLEPSCRAAAVLTFWPAATAWRLLPYAHGLGFTKQRCLYMKKRDPKPQFGTRTRWSIEPVWALSRDGFLLLGDSEDIVDASTPRAGRDADATGHPYQKPISVMRWLIAKLPPSCLVIDPFAGSGSTLLAAKALGHPAIGVELEERWCEAAASRLQQAMLFA